MIIDILAAFQFLTVFPPLITRPFTLPELGRSTAYYPLVGLVLGGVLYALGSGLTFILPPLPTAAMLVAAWIIFTRGLHFDGLLDTVDGLFGGFTPTRRLEIMRDSRVGAFAVAGGGLLLLGKFAALVSLPSLSPGLILAPVLGRLGITLAVVFYPYAREKGMGRGIKNNAGWLQAAAATLITVAAAWWVGGWSGLAAYILTLAVIIGWLEFVRSRIPGMTGDIYGATCELLELIALSFFSLTIIG